MTNKFRGIVHYVFRLSRSALFIMSEKAKATNPDTLQEEDDAPAVSPPEAEKKRKSDDSKKSKSSWTAAEDDALLKAVLEDQQDREAEGDGEEEEDWDEIAKSVTGKTPVQCLKRYMVLNRKQGGKSIERASSSADEKDEDPESHVAKKPKRVKVKEPEASSGKWTHDEMELLKKLVEQYKDSK